MTIFTMIENQIIGLLIIHEERTLKEIHDDIPGISKQMLHDVCDRSRRIKKMGNQKGQTVYVLQN